MGVIKRIIKWCGITLGVLLAIFAIALGVVYAKHESTDELPRPTGSFSVGRTFFEWEDSARKDPLSKNADELRKLFVWVWYPSAPTGGKIGPYLSENWLAARRGFFGWGRFLLQDPANIQGHSIDDASITRGGPLPVLIFLPGLGPIASDYTSINEDLASHGYVVLAPTITYSSQVVAFSGGRVVRANHEKGLPENASPEEAPRAERRLLHVWIADTKFVMSHVELLNGESGSRFSGRLDLNRIGLAGHSFGGATALELQVQLLLPRISRFSICRVPLDERIKP